MNHLYVLVKLTVFHCVFYINFVAGKSWVKRTETPKSLTFVIAVSLNEGWMNTEKDFLPLSLKGFSVLLFF